MNPITTEQVREMILDECADALSAFGMTTADVAEDLDLRQYGLIDSLGFLELVTALEERLAITLDLANLPPEELTVIGPLSRAVAAQAAAQNGTTALHPHSTS